MDAEAPVALALDATEDPWASNGGKANFGFNVFSRPNSQTNTQTIRGHLNYLNKLTGEHVKSVAITSLVVNPLTRTATFRGTCTNNGLPCTFECTVQDNGNPGRGRDQFSISGMGIIPNSDTLNGGNIVIHKFR
jgi:hypothetical protein